MIAGRNPFPLSRHAFPYAGSFPGAARQHARFGGRRNLLPTHRSAAILCPCRPAPRPALVGAGDRAAAVEKVIFAAYHPVVADGALTLQAENAVQLRRTRRFAMGRRVYVVSPTLEVQRTNAVHKPRPAQHSVLSITTLFVPWPLPSLNLIAAHKDKPICSGQIFQFVRAEESKVYAILFNIRGLADQRTKDKTEIVLPLFKLVCRPPTVPFQSSL